jgi:hypothetical protein
LGEFIRAEGAASRPLRFVRIEAWGEISSRIARRDATPHAKREDALCESQQIIRRSRRTPLEIIEHPGNVRRRDISRREAAEFRYQVLVEIPPRHSRMLEPARLDLDAIPVFAKRLEGTFLPFILHRCAQHAKGILLPVF